MKRIGKYEACGLLGRGGMAAVYKARLPVAEKIVALKHLNPHPHLVELLGMEELERRFALEARTMASLRHPNVADVLDFDSSSGRPFFTMEYYFQNLGAIMGEGYRVEEPSRVFGLDKAIHYTRQILSGLCRMHRAGIVHRDIKPFNILLTDQDGVKISDFGLSKLRGERSINRSNLMVGSPFYASPEQERDPEGVDGRSDLYAVGVILYRMLAGRLPEEGAPPASEVHPDVSRPWDAFLSRALEPERANRFASAESMLEELNALSRAWEARKESLCRMALFEPPIQELSASSPSSLRSSPLRVNPKRALSVFGCDPLWRPLSYTAKELAPLDGDSILDRATGLIWQKRGSPDPVTWDEAFGYVEELNGGNGAGFGHWRLPTIDELLTLLTPPVYGLHECIEGEFDRSKRWLWSCDRKSFAAAWYVDCELGFAGFGDFSCRFHVRAVCSEGSGRSSGPLSEYPLP